MEDNNGFYVDEEGNIIYEESTEEIPQEETAEDGVSDGVADDSSDDVFSQNFLVDEDGNLIYDEEGNPIPVEVQEEPGVTVQVNPSDSSLSVVTPGSTQTVTVQLPQSETNYDDLIEALASVPSYNIYPNTTAVQVYELVLDSLDENVGYFIASGSSSSDVYLYYSEKYTVSGNTLTLQSPVTQCRYYTYRASSSSSTEYRYNVTTLSDISITLSNQLVYTNLKDGYPDVMSYKKNESYSMIVTCAICALICAVATVSTRFVLKKGEKND